MKAESRTARQFGCAWRSRWGRHLPLRLRGQDLAVATASAVASLSAVQVLRSWLYLVAYELRHQNRDSRYDPEPDISQMYGTEAVRREIGAKAGV
jgi:hypothetical protein